MTKNILLFLLFSIPVCAQQKAPLPIDSCSVDVPFGMPVNHHKIDSQMICRSAYLVQFDNNAHIPSWVSYELTPQHALGCLPRKDAFAADQSDSHSAKPSDYAHNGYDMGHIANDSDMSWDIEIQKESFILTNMTPQLPNLNRGRWKNLEDDIRDWAVERNHTLLIYAGPIYDINADKKIGSDNVDVPSAFYKIIFDTISGDVLSFVFPQEVSDDKSIVPLEVPESKVEDLTGILFPLPATVNKSVVYSLWPYDRVEYNKQKESACK